MTEPVKSTHNSIKSTGLRLRKRIRSFFRRHNGLITFVGATIVFATFVIKENIREHYRDLANSIDTTETFYVTRTDMAFTNSSLQKLRGILGAGPDVMGEEREYMVYAGMLDNIKHLHRKLSHDAQEDHQISDLDDLIAKEKTLEEHEADPHFATTDALRQALGDEQLAFNRQRGALTVKERLTYFGDKVLDKAQKERDKAEKDNSIATKASIFLYVFGWGIGLLAKLYGIEGAPGE